MPNGKVSYAELVHQVVQGASEPLPFAEIVRRVSAIVPITTRDPKATVRGAISGSRLIAATGDGRYGWKARLIKSAVLRLTLAAEDLTGQSLVYSDEIQEALYPALFGSQKYRDVRPIIITLPIGTTTQLSRDFFGPGRWGTVGTPELWGWLGTQKAKPGDHLLVEVLNGETRSYSMSFQHRADRDEPAIAERNQTVVAAAIAHLKSRPNGATIWETAAHLLATGQYLHPVPPDPLSEIWTREVWGPVMETKGVRGGWALSGGFAGGGQSPEVAQPAERIFEADALLAQISQLSADLNAQFSDQSDNPDAPVLPPEYLPGPNRRPRASQAAQRGTATIVVVRVSHRDHPKAWREIEIAADQTLEDLHLAIQQAYSWNDDHLYSFFMSGQPFDGQSEIGSPWSEAVRHTHEVAISELELRRGQRFLYLFDYGDNHEFDVEVVRVNPAAPGNSYPKVIAQQGRSPRQYR